MVSCCPVEPRQPSPAPTVAVVDDDASMCRAVERLLRAGGFEPATFPSAEAFLAQTSPATHRCLILDLHMPGMSGVTLYRHLESIGVHLPVVFITAHDEGTERDEARRVPGSRFLCKPFSGVDLLGAVRDALATAGPPSGESEISA